MPRTEKTSRVIGWKGARGREAIIARTAIKLPPREADDGRVRLLPLAALLLFLMPAAHGEGVAVKRHVIALVEGKEPEPELMDDVHGLFEMPLNQLGMVVLHHFIRNGPPPAEWFDDACAVLVYLPYDGQAPDWLWPWLETEVPRHELRVVIVGEIGQLLVPDESRFAKWIEPFGLAFGQNFAKGPLQVVAEFRDARLCAYEADPRRYAVHEGPKSTSPRNRVWVTTRLSEDPEDVRHPVVTGPWGGIALDPWAVQSGSDDNDRRWHLDPFAFFREALGLEGVPAPDPSILNGRRMWFLQIDGDGFESLSSVKADAYCARVMLDEVFKKYALPFTVSVIVRSLTEDYDVKEPTPRMELAREILNLPNVEPASHGVLHTLRWQDAAPPDGGTSGMGGLKWYASLDHYKYSRVNEVKESIRFINERLLEPPRRCALMLWTGNAVPPEEAILAAKEMGAKNLNGGVFRWDPWFDSVGFVTPWSRRVGKALQVYAGASNENDFEGFFDTMPGAFAHVAETISRTGTPRVLKPADIYAHFYSAESPPRLRALDGLIRRFAFKEETAPVFASTYVEAVEAAAERAHVRKMPDGWILQDFGGCRTARIDGDPRDVDFEKSRGLLGARRVGDSLYLHLAASDARVVLAGKPAPRPHVEQANCLLDHARLVPTGVTVTATAHNDRIVVFAGFPPNAPLLLSLDAAQSTAQADPMGRLEVRLPGPGETTISVLGTAPGPGR